MDANTNFLNKPFTIFIWLTAAVGLVVFLYALRFFSVSAFSGEFAVIAGFTLFLGSRIAVYVEKIKVSLSIGDAFVFLTMFLYGGETAAVLAFAEAFFTSSRFTKQNSFRFFNAGTMAISIYAACRLTEILFGSITEIGKSGIGEKQIFAVTTFFLAHYFINTGLMAFAGSFRSQKSFIDCWKKDYFWIFVPFLANSFAALITSNVIANYGFYTFFVALPIVGIIYFGYKTYDEKLTAVTAQAEQSKKHLIELTESEERFRSAFNNAPIGMALVAPDGRWLSVNDALCNIFNRAEEDFLQNHFHNFVCAEDLVDFLKNIGWLIQGENTFYQAEIRYQYKNEQPIWTQTSVSLLSGTTGQTSRLIFQIQDITARKTAEENLRYHAFYDSLTSVANRSLFIERLNESIVRAKREKDFSFAVSFIDLDRFKIVNESIGHRLGDEVLINVAQRLKKTISPEHTIARIGSDEFVILFENVRDRKEVIAEIEEVQSQIAIAHYVGGHEIFVTSSVGLVFYHEAHEQAEMVLRDADAALNLAKTQGRARYVLFDQNMREKATNRLQLEGDLHRAIERGEIFVVYQPIMSLRENRLAGFESLVRWNHPKLGFISPAEFIPIAEENGCIAQIGEFVLDESCRQMSEWQKRFSHDLPLTMNVNLSVKQLFQRQIFTNVLSILEKHRVAPKHIKLEITESVIVDNVEFVINILKQFRALGIQLSMDDFGTGYSSLSYLHRLPITTLKIDRSFVNQIVEENESAEIVKTILLLARTLKLDVVAEGIETESQLEFLRRLDCDYGQGYFFSKPVSAAEAGKVVEAFLESAVDAQPGVWQESAPETLYHH